MDQLKVKLYRHNLLLFEFEISFETWYLKCHIRQWDSGFEFCPSLAQTRRRNNK